jgi:hypothetical protein
MPNRLQAVFGRAGARLLGMHPHDLAQIRRGGDGLREGPAEDELVTSEAPLLQDRPQSALLPVNEPPNSALLSLIIRDLG